MHLWPYTTALPRTCSSVCAHREPVETLSPAWTAPQDADAIGERLAGGGGSDMTGKDKGRVLYLIERTPLRGTHRVAAVALLSVPDRRLFRLYRMCFNEDVISHESSNRVA